MIELNKVYNEPCIETLRHMDDNSIDCVVTSPPYYALRKYTDSEFEIGREQTPSEYIDNLVEVFTEVYRVLKPTGTVWVNIGDTYNGNKVGNTNEKWKNVNTDNFNKEKWNGCKNKDLIGIPWYLAFALRGPFYHGKIRKEADRRWLAAIIDGEGSICGTIHERKDGDGIRSSVYICVTNTNTQLLDECERIYPFGKNLMHQKNGTGHLGKRDVFRWSVFGAKEKKELIQEIYPFLIAKKKQALLAYNFFLFQETSKKDGHSERKDEVNEKRNDLIKLISQLNNGQDVIIPNWCEEPKSLYTQGFYLRQDIIWHKPNPMPESVTDRCTKSHEYIFLMSKSQRYYFDHEAIQEPATTQADNSVKIKFGGNKYGNNDDKHFQTYSGKEWVPKTKNCMEDGQKPNTMHLRREQGLPDEQYVVRNKRDVWSVNVKPDTVAHFATYPEELIRPCILAGCPKDGMVLDPFMGSGTTARVAMKLDRNYIGFELNPEYCKIINTKTREIQKELFT